MILQMAKTFKTDGARASNDQMIMKRNAHHRQRLFNVFCHFDIGALRLGFCARMIMHNDNGMGEMPEREINDFARIDRGLINRSA